MGLFNKTRRVNKIAIVGRRGSGKTTLMYKLSNQPLPSEMTPTACETLEKFVIGPENHKLLFAEQKRITPECDGLILVAKPENIEEQLSIFLGKINESDAFAIKPLVILVNDRNTKPEEPEEPQENKESEEPKQVEQTESSQFNDVAPTDQLSIDAIVQDIAPKLGMSRSFQVMSYNFVADDVSGVVNWIEHNVPLY